MSRIPYILITGVDKSSIRYWLCSIIENGNISLGGCETTIDSTGVIGVSYASFQPEDALFNNTKASVDQMNNNALATLNELLRAEQTSNQAEEKTSLRRTQFFDGRPLNCNTCNDVDSMVRVLVNKDNKERLANAGIVYNEETHQFDINNPIPAATPTIPAPGTR